MGILFFLLLLVLLLYYCYCREASGAPGSHPARAGCQPGCGAAAPSAHCVGGGREPGFVPGIFAGGLGRGLGGLKCSFRSFREFGGLWRRRIERVQGIKVEDSASRGLPKNLRDLNYGILPGEVLQVSGFSSPVMSILLYDQASLLHLVILKSL